MTSILAVALFYAVTLHMLQTLATLYLNDSGVSPAMWGASLFVNPMLFGAVAQISSPQAIFYVGGAPLAALALLTAPLFRWAYGTVSRRIRVCQQTLERASRLVSALLRCNHGKGLNGNASIRRGLRQQPISSPQGGLTLQRNLQVDRIVRGGDIANPGKDTEAWPKG